LGHRHIAFLNHTREEFAAGYGPAVRAQRHFLDATTTHNLQGLTRFCESHPEAGYAAVNDLLLEDPDLTAIIVMNDQTVPGIVRAIKDKGWCIPGDFSIVAIVSSAQVAEMMTPPITTAEAPAYELARLSTEMLIQQLDGQKKDFSEVLVPCELVVRQSSGLYPKTRLTLGD
jgi:DNA-binding LacI/PurR family transcriptional regulator